MSGRRILVVGAGAVGQVYARHLQLGGARVALMVKDKYADEARRGFTMYALRKLGGPRRVRLEGCDVLTSPDAVARERWDQIWLCMSSTAMKQPWLDALAPVSGDATIVGLTPGLEDRDHLIARFGADRVVSGVITFISYQAPLPTESLPEPGVAYWLPPMTPGPFSGPPARVDDVVSALRAGRYPARRVDDAAFQGTVGSAMMMPAIAALEAAGWSFTALRKSELLPLAAAASQEAARIVAAYHDRGVPFAARQLRAWVLRGLLRVAPWAVPLPLEPYLAYHFTKVGDQTRALFQTWSARGAERGLPVSAIQRLGNALDAPKAA